MVINIYFIIIIFITYYIGQTRNLDDMNAFIETIEIDDNIVSTNHQVEKLLNSISTTTLPKWSISTKRILEGLQFLSEKRLAITSTKKKMLDDLTKTNIEKAN